MAGAYLSGIAPSRQRDPGKILSKISISGNSYKQFAALSGTIHYYWNFIISLEYDEFI